MNPPSISQREVEALRDLVAAADSVQAPLVTVGATARQLVFNDRYGIASHRSTTDWDFGVFVADWAAFSRLKHVITAAGRFKVTPGNEHRILHLRTGVEIDLIPFGGVENDGVIQWPGGGQVMNVTGYEDALSLAEEIAPASDLRLRVATVPLLAVLKLFAAADRASHTDRDLTDLDHLLVQYPTAGREGDVWEWPLAEMADELDWDFLGAFLLGADIGIACRIATLERLDPLVAEFGNPFGRFSRLAARNAVSDGDELRRRNRWAHRFVWLRHGMRLARKGRT